MEPSQTQISRTPITPIRRKLRQGCAKCQESKVITHMKRAPLYPFDTHVEQGPFQYVSMDLITDLPRSNRYDAILTIVDQGCSKAAKFLPCNKTIDGQGVAQLYFKHLFPWFGIPKRIISDRDPRFTSHFAKAVCKATGIQQNISTAFHPSHRWTNRTHEQMDGRLPSPVCHWKTEQLEHSPASSGVCTQFLEARTHETYPSRTNHRGLTPSHRSIPQMTRFLLRRND
jgi:hypothetical protein